MTLTHARAGALTLLVVGISHAAWAQESDDRFAGLYLGAEAGANFNDSDLGDAGFTFGGIAGYRWQSSSNFLWGIEGTFGKPESPSSLGTIFDVDYNYDWSAAVTAAITFGDTNLIFAKAGWAGLQADRNAIRYEPDENGNPQPVGFSRQGFHDDGLRLGLGYEHAISDSLSLRVSADYTDLSGGAEMIKTTAGILFQF